MKIASEFWIKFKTSLEEEAFALLKRIVLTEFKRVPLAIESS
jgi:hypothetical protein